MEELPFPYNFLTLTCTFKIEDIHPELRKIFENAFEKEKEKEEKKKSRFFL